MNNEFKKVSYMYKGEKFELDNNVGAEKVNVLMNSNIVTTTILNENEEIKGYNVGLIGYCPETDEIIIGLEDAD